MVVISNRFLQLSNLIPADTLNCVWFCILVCPSASLRERMDVIRSKTTPILLLLGVLLIATHSRLLRHAPLSSLQSRTILTSSTNFAGGSEPTGATGCHEESAPKERAPQNHDCCTFGHLHAIASAPLAVAPRLPVTAFNCSRRESASADQVTSPSDQISDTGPPGSALPIRI